MSNIYAMADTWNNVATAFTAIKMDVTDTASAAGSKLLDLLVGGVSKLEVLKSGVFYIANSNAANPQLICKASVTSNAVGLWLDTERVVFTGGAAELFVMNRNGGVPIFNINYGGSLVINGDTGVARNAAGVLEINSGTTGTFRDLIARNVRTRGSTVAGLVAAATAGAGARAFVTDANATLTAGIGAVVVGGSTNGVPVCSDGTDWRIG